MTSPSTTPWLPQSEIETAEHLFDNWFDPIEAGLRDRAREFLQAMLEGGIEMVLASSRYARRGKPASDDADGAGGGTGHRHGHRPRYVLWLRGQLENTVTVCGMYI